MKIGVIGLGYVGLTTALALAAKNNEIIGHDVDERKVVALENGRVPLYEKGAAAILEQVLGTSFHVTRNLEVLLEQSEVIFACVPTPTRLDGSMDDHYLLQVMRDIGMLIKTRKDRGHLDCPLLVIKSTVIPGTTARMRDLLQDEFGLKYGEDFRMAMVPEFLRQGKAIEDALNPSRIVCGVWTNQERMILGEVFASFSSPKFFVTPETAEFVKYAANSFLALKISFANELANIITKFLERYPDARVDVDDVVRLMGMDPRINPSQMKAGIGFGGSCFPKDVKAFVSVARMLGYEPSILPQILEVNERQAFLPIEFLRAIFGGRLEGRTVAILGLAFKPGTDDVRESPALRLVQALMEEKVIVKVHDPRAMDNFRKHHPESSVLRYCNSIESCLKWIDAAVLVTDWPEIVWYLEHLEVRDFVLFDGRGVLTNADVSIGRKMMNGSASFQA